MSRKKNSRNKKIALLVGGSVVAFVLWRAFSARRESPADLLRRVVVSEEGDSRDELLRRYQESERLPSTGQWNLETSAAAEMRLSSFGPAARALLNHGLASDPFFRGTRDLAKPN